MTKGGYTFPLADRLSGVTSSPVRDILAVLARGDIISFAGGIPEPDLFEVDDIRASFDHVLTHQAKRALQYSATDGEPELRQAAADMLSRRGLPTTADQIQITTGSQEGLFLIGQTLISPGDVVLVEEPTYLAAVQAFALCGAEMFGVPCDDDGPVAAELERMIGEKKPKFVYLIPTFQNPSGRTIPLERRQEIADVLKRTGTPLVEDDPYGELRFEGEHVPSIASLPGMGQQTLLLNSLSKVMAPGLRIGWIRGEGDILATIGIAKQAVALQVPVTDQLAAAYYLTHYDLDLHIKKVAEVYRERRDAMYHGLQDILPEGSQVTYPTGGMFLWVTLPEGWDTGELLTVAVAEGVACVPGAGFFARNAPKNCMRMSYVTNSPETIAEGLKRLKRAMDEVHG